MPKFREWRSRLSNHEAGFGSKSLRCINCRNWFQPLSKQDKTCTKCCSKTTSLPSKHEFFISASNPGKIGPLSASSPNETSSSSSAHFFYTPNFRTHLHETRKNLDTMSNRDTPVWNLSSIEKHNKQLMCNIANESLDDEGVVTEGIIFSPIKGSINLSRFQRFSSTPSWLAEQEAFLHRSASTGLHKESLRRCPARTQLRTHGTQAREISNSPDKQCTKPSIGTQTEPSQNDVSVQVELIPNFFYDLFKKQTELVEYMGDNDEAVSQFESEIAAMSSDPLLLEFIATRNELLNYLEKLDAEYILANSRMANKRNPLVLRNEEAKRTLDVLVASKEECQTARDNVKVAEGLVLRSRQVLQHYEDLLERARQQLLDETNEELREIRRTSISKQENRVALAKKELERYLQQRSLAYDDLKDAEQYHRDKEDILKISMSRITSNDYQLDSASLDAIEKEAAFIHTQLSNTEKKCAAKLLALIKKKEDLVRCKFHQALSGLLQEKKYFAQLVLQNQAEKEIQL